jgi:Protein of unknown function (DUF3574)
MNRAPCRLRSTRPGNELAALLIAFGAAAASPAHAEGCVAPTSAMQQVKLYFGSSVRGRPFVTEWSQFLASEVTPKFPGGLTVSDARGQWRSGDGRTLSRSDPRARHPYKADATTDGKIETIRGAYKKQFHQENPLSGSTPSSAPLFDGSLATFSSRRKRI